MHTLVDIYFVGSDDYQAFDYDDRGLAEWMTSGCNIGKFRRTIRVTSRFVEA